MKFDVFHSVGRVDGLSGQLSDREVFRLFFEQVEAAEAMGYETIWVAESHFSSEVQKANAEPVIPHYRGEVGLNCDSLQLAQVIFARTQRIGFGTAILNIVGGNGGPIAAADRVRSLAWLNSLQAAPRQLAIGVAAGRFPYINRPFGIVPRDDIERLLWPAYQQLIFVEALEVFLRLSRDETLSSAMLARHQLGKNNFRDEEAFASACTALAKVGQDEAAAMLRAHALPYKPRWEFEPLKLVPSMPLAKQSDWLRFVLGSTCTMARELALRYADVDVFNLSFTPPEAIERMHGELAELYARAGLTWARARMPRTVLVFIDRNPDAARERASRCFDTYIEAMRDTAKFPPKDALMARALIGDASMIREQLAQGSAHGFHPDDRLMLWFEFNQTDGEAIRAQMRLFAEEVLPQFAS